MSRSLHDSSTVTSKASASRSAHSALIGRDSLSTPAPPKYLEVRGADGSVQVIDNVHAFKASVASGATEADNGTSAMSGSVIKSVESMRRVMPHASDGKYNSYGVENKDRDAGKSHLYRRDGELFQREQDRIKNEPKRFAPPKEGDVALNKTRLAERLDKAYDMQPHQFSIRVDSRSDHKQSKNGVPRVVPDSAGSVYNYAVINRAPVAPTLPRAYPPPSKEMFADAPLLGNRAPDGRILGSYQRRYAEPDKVPYRVPERPLGPDNPSKVLSAEWTAYYDESAQAVYYYNSTTLEATWIKPPI